MERVGCEKLQMKVQYEVRVRSGLRLLIILLLILFVQKSIIFFAEWREMKRSMEDAPAVSETVEFNHIAEESIQDDIAVCSSDMLERSALASALVSEKVLANAMKADSAVVIQDIVAENVQETEEKDKIDTVEKDIFTIMTAPNGKEETNIIIENVACITQLRQDYCVGSTEVIPSLNLEYIMSDGSRVKVKENEYTVGVLDTASAGKKVLSVHCGDRVIEIPYQVVDYTVILHLNGGNYEFDMLHAYDYAVEIPGNPARVGYGEGNWYQDEACTIPLDDNVITMEHGETKLHLYAGYEVLGEYILDDAGYVIGYQGILPKSIMLPDNCVGVRSGAFAGLDTSKVQYVYIPANVTDLEPGAFIGMANVKDYLVISEENPVYCSINGMVMSKDQSIVYVYPAGRKGEDYLPGTLNYIADYAFYDAAVAALVFEGEYPPSIGGANCFTDCDANIMIPGGGMYDGFEVSLKEGGWSGILEMIE